MWNKNLNFEFYNKKIKDLIVDDIFPKKYLYIMLIVVKFLEINEL